MPRSFDAHLRRAGLRLSATPRALDEALRRLMGPRRFDRHLRVLHDYAEGLVPATDLYRTLRTFDEAMVFQSHQAPLIRAIGRRLLAQIDGIPAPKAIADLGCFTGELAAWIAIQRPESTVIGFDREPGPLRWARARFARPNLRFRRRDHAAEPSPRDPSFDVLVSALGIDFVWGEEAHSLGDRSVRGSPAYWRTVAECHAVFRGWRRMAAPNAALFAVLRVTNLARFLAVVDAAADAGWTFDLRRSRRLRVAGAALLSGAWRASHEPPATWLPGVARWCAGRTWTDTLGATADEGQLLDWWCGERLRPASGVWRGDEALLAWRRMADARSAGEQGGVRADGVVLRAEWGAAGRRRFAAVWAADGGHVVVVHPATRASAVSARLARERGISWRV